VIETATFVCSICGETSTDICVYCTKDTCANHRCLRCLRCSDCCECEVPLTAGGPEGEPASQPVHPEPVMAPTDPEPGTIVLSEPQASPTVEQATTPEELVRALPELFVPELEEPSKPAASEAADTNPPRPGPEPDEKP